MSSDQARATKSVRLLAPDNAPGTRCRAFSSGSKMNLVAFHGSPPRFVTYSRKNGHLKWRENRTNYLASNKQDDKDVLSIFYLRKLFLCQFFVPFLIGKNEFFCLVSQIVKCYRRRERRDRQIDIGFDGL